MRFRKGICNFLKLTALSAAYTRLTDCRCSHMMGSLGILAKGLEINDQDAIFIFFLSSFSLSLNVTVIYIGMIYAFHYLSLNLVHYKVELEITKNKAV